VFRVADGVLDCPGCHDRHSRRTKKSEHLSIADFGIFCNGRTPFSATVSVQNAFSVAPEKAVEDLVAAHGQADPSWRTPETPGRNAQIRADAAVLTDSRMDGSGCRVSRRGGGGEYR
jgi:hypothetical protein